MKLKINKKTRKHKRRRGGGNVGDDVIIDLWGSLVHAFNKSSPFKKGDKSSTGSSPDEDGSCPSVLTKIIRMANKGKGKFKGLDISGLSVAELKKGIQLAKDQKDAATNEADDRLAAGEDKEAAAGEDKETPAEETPAEETPAEEKKETPAEEKKETPAEGGSGATTKKRRKIKSGKSRKYKRRKNKC